MTNNSIFTRVLALMLCLIMLVGTLTACFNEVDPENNVGTTTNGGVVTTNPTTKPTTTTPTTGDVVEDNPVEDPVEPVDPNEIFSASTDILSDGLIYGTLASDVVIGGAEMGALVPADVKVEAGASSLALSVKKVDEVLLSDALSTLDVHINGVALDNTVPMVVKLGAILEAGLGATELKLYHTENGVDNLMTRVNSPSDFAIHNQYYYNAETGEVTIYVASFSVFTAVKSTADVWDGTSDTTWYNETDTEFTLTSAEQLAGFRDLVDGGNTFAGKVVKLGADIDLKLYKDVVVKNEDGSTTTTQELVSFDPIGNGYVHNGGKAFMGTFDGQGHTIYNLYQNGWDLGYSYSTVGGGLFASIKDATIKNLAISGANIVMECIDMGTVVGYAQGKCTFENIVVTDSKLANYQRYTGGVVGEVCKGDGIEDTYTHTFTNVTVDSSVKISSLWGDFDNACGGVIGGKWGTARVLMQNVTVACEIDAFSDVTAAYQWYAYRRCGMLIGHTEQNSPKSALNAAAEFLTCENVNVYYGDWVNYTYYQFAEQTDEAGTRLWNSNYPWVRAEAGEYNGAFSNVRYGNPIIKGEKINTVERAKELGAPSVTIIFNQLYGGGQGVYGAADHNYNGGGVTIHNSLTKTVYIQNNLNWNNLKLHYWFANGDDRWTTVVEGMGITEISNGIYRVDVPAYADGFMVIGTDGYGATISTSEINCSEIKADSTYPLNAFQLTFSVEDLNDDLNVITGNWLQNIPVYNQSNPRAERYDVVIYDKSYTGDVETNPYGVAIVIDENGALAKIYDAANGGYYTKAGKAQETHFNSNNFASVAWSELKSGETLIIFPNEGNGAANISRAWALKLRSLMGKKVTIEGTINTDVHVCTDVCETCLGCENKACTNVYCVSNRCYCLEISVNVTINGFENTHKVTADYWLYNTQVNTNNYPYAEHYKVLVYDKDYQGTFTTNSFGLALVIDADGNLVKAYNAAPDGKNSIYYTLDTTTTITGVVSEYAHIAWAELQEGETLIIFPNHVVNQVTDNTTRNWARELCNNWNTIKGSKVIPTSNKLPQTIYYQDNQKWNDVTVHYWDAEGNETTVALGSATYSDGTYGIYRVKLPASAVKVAFSKTDSEIKTVEITELNNGYVYLINGQTVNATLYKEGYKTVYFQNNWLWTSVKVNYFGQSYDMTFVEYDGVYNIYKAILPSYLTVTISDGTNEVNKHTQPIDVSDLNNNAMLYMNYTDKDGHHALIDDYTTYKSKHTKVTLQPTGGWKSDNARFAAYVWVSNVNNKWIDMVDVDGDGKYTCWVPNEYKNIKFCRMNPKHLDNRWNTETDTEETKHVWNDTGDLTVTSGDKYYLTSVMQWVTANNKVFYLKPNSNWTQSSARFAAYFFNNSTNKNEWVDMIDPDFDGIYACVMPTTTTYANIIFCRMNPNNTANRWNTSDNEYNKPMWNQTADLGLNNGNTYTIDSGSWNAGKWSTVAKP